MSSCSKKTLLLVHQHPLLVEEDVVVRWVSSLFLPTLSRTSVSLLLLQSKWLEFVQGYEWSEWDLA